MLGGSNDHLVTPDARAQRLGGRTRCCDAKKKSLRAVQTEEAETGTYLRKILGAKQEPFVLQEVIWEKRHPVRTRSSRELKFDLNDMAPSTSKSQNRKRAKSKSSRRHSEAGCDDDLPALSHRQGEASSALVKGYNVPAESMVALPSPQASPHRRKTRPSSSKMSSAGKSPVKSPNKRALLMEAAAKILEGSNRRASKLASSSACSLLRELDGSKQTQELLKLKETPIEKASFGVELTTRQKRSLQNVTTLEQRQVESRKQQSNADNSSSFVNQSQQDLSTLSSSFEITEEVSLVMKSRVFSSEEMPAARKESSQPSTPADNLDILQQSNHVQGPNACSPKMDRTKEERLMVDVSLQSVQKISDLRPANGETYQEAGFVMVSEVEGREHRQIDRDALVDRSKELESASYADSSSIISVNGLPPVQEFVNSLERNTSSNHSQVEISNVLHELPMPRKVPVDDIRCSIDTARSRNCEIGIGDDDCAQAYTLLDINLYGLLESHERSVPEPVIDEEISTAAPESDTKETVSTPVLFLCNYSWWKQEEIQAHSSALKNETLNECAGYDSPSVATKGPCVVKLFEERKEVENLEEDSSTSSDHSYAEEFQQSSPVSVLDMVYDDGPVLGKPFDYFDEARQKLLESVRRYEMLAHMDLDMLMKINEDNHCHEFEEESDSSSFKESLGCDATDTSATHHQVPFMASPDYQSRYRSFPKIEADGLGLNSAYDSYYEATEEDLYIHSHEDFCWQRLQEMTDEDAKSTSDFMMDAGASFKAGRESTSKALLDCVSEPLDLHDSRGLCLRSTRINSSRDALDEVERLTGSIVINTMLSLDITTNCWNSFHEEVEVMEMELESSLFATLMQELLLDLQY